MGFIYGQVAQLVEQWIENPLVGGSSPPRAILFFIFFFTGCTQDNCLLLCEQLTNQISTCISKWPTDWADFDATRKLEFETECTNRWYAERSELEGRELSDAQDQCEESTVILKSMEQRCDQLRAIFLADPSY